MSNVTDAFQNNVARHAHDVFGVWVGVGGAGRGGIIKNVEVIFKEHVQHHGCFPEQCGNNVTPHACDVFGVWGGVGWGGIIINVTFVFKQNVYCYCCSPKQCSIPIAAICPSKQKHGLFNPQLWEWTCCFQWRFNAGKRPVGSGASSCTDR